MSVAIESLSPMSFTVLDKESASHTLSLVHGNALRQLEDIALDRLRHDSVSKWALLLWLSEHKNSLYDSKGLHITTPVWQTITELESSAYHLSCELKTQWLKYHQDLRMELGPLHSNKYQDLPQTLTWAERTQNDLLRHLENTGRRSNYSAQVYRYPLVSVELFECGPETLRAKCLAHHTVGKFHLSELGNWVENASRAREQHAERVEACSRLQEHMVGIGKKLEEAHQCLELSRKILGRLQTHQREEVAARKQDYRLAHSTMQEALQNLKMDESLQQACEKEDWVFLREYAHKLFGTDEEAQSTRECFYRITAGTGDLMPRRCYTLARSIHAHLRTLSGCLQGESAHSLREFPPLELENDRLYDELELQQLAQRLALLPLGECLKRVPMADGTEEHAEQGSGESCWYLLERQIDQELQRLSQEQTPEVNQLALFFDWLQKAQALLRDSILTQSRHMQKLTDDFTECKTRLKRDQKQLHQAAKATATVIARTFPLQGLHDTDIWPRVIRIIQAAAARQGFPEEVKALRAHVRSLSSLAKDGRQKADASYGKAVRSRGSQGLSPGRRGIYEIVLTCFQLRLVAPKPRVLTIASGGQATRDE